MPNYHTLTYGDLLDMAEKYGFSRETQIVVQEPFTESVYEFPFLQFSHLDGVLYLTIPEESPTKSFFRPESYEDGIGGL